MVPLEPEFTDAEKEATFEQLRMYPTINGKYADIKRSNDDFISVNIKDYEYAITDRINTGVRALEVFKLLLRFYQ